MSVRKAVDEVLTPRRNWYAAHFPRFVSTVFHDGRERERGRFFERNDPSKNIYSVTDGVEPLGDLVNLS